METDITHIYVVDAANRPLAVMETEQVLRQGLKHRGVFVVLWTATGRLLLRRRPTDHPVYPGRWDIAGSGHVPAGMAAEDAALGLMPDLSGEPELRHIKTLNASAHTGNAFVEVFGARLADHVCAPLLHNPTFMVVDRDEMGALAASYPDQLTPALMTVWTDAIAFAPS